MTGPAVFGEIGEPGTEVADLGELLFAYVDWYRDRVLRKIAGLSESQLRTPVEPLGWSPLGLVQHLGWVERRWLQWGFAAENVTAYPPGGDEAEWGVPDGREGESVLSGYLAEVARSRQIVAGVELHTVAATGGRFPHGSPAPSLGRIFFHLLQEYARHVGQLDVVREIVDGVTGE